jgi:hypothetical protein
VYEDIASHRPFYHLITHHRAAYSLTKRHELAGHVFDSRRAATKARQALINQFLLTKGFLKVLIDPRFKIRIVL